MNKVNKENREPKVIDNIITSTIRIPESFHNDIKKISDETGSSMNSTMLFLMRFGTRFLNSNFAIHFQDEQK